MSEIIIISLIINLFIQKSQLAICNYYPNYLSTGSRTAISHNCGSLNCCRASCPTTSSAACCSINYGQNYCNSSMCNYYPNYLSGSISPSSYNCGSRYCCGSSCPTTTSAACCSANYGLNYCYSSSSTSSSTETNAGIAGWLIGVIVISVLIPLIVALSIIIFCCNYTKKRRVTRPLQSLTAVPAQTVVIAPKSNNPNLYAPNQSYATVNVPLQNNYNQPLNYNYPPVYNSPVYQINNNIEPTPVYPNSVY